MWVGRVKEGSDGKKKYGERKRDKNKKNVVTERKREK